MAEASAVFLTQVQAMTCRKGTFSPLCPLSFPSAVFLLDLEQSIATSENTISVFKYSLFPPSLLSMWGQVASVIGRCRGWNWTVSKNAVGNTVGYPQHNVLDNMLRTLILISIKGLRVRTGNIHIQTFTLDI